MESSKSEPALGTDKKARSSMARAGGAAKRASTVVKLSKGGKKKSMIKKGVAASSNRLASGQSSELRDVGGNTEKSLSALEGLVAGDEPGGLNSAEGAMRLQAMMQGESMKLDKGKKLKSEFGAVDEGLLDALKAEPDDRTDDHLKLIEKHCAWHPIFKDIKPMLRRKMFRYLRAKFFKFGEVIVLQGDEAASFCICYQGSMSVHLWQDPAKVKEMRKGRDKLMAKPVVRDKGELLELLPDKVGTRVGVLKQGNSFGENGMDPSGKAKRSATVLSVEEEADTILFELCRHDVMTQAAQQPAQAGVCGFQGVSFTLVTKLKIPPEDRTEQDVAFIDDHVGWHPFLSPLDMESRMTIVKYLTLATYDKDRVIMLQEDAADAFYITYSGEVEVYQNGKGGQADLEVWKKGMSRRVEAMQEKIKAKESKDRERLLAEHYARLEAEQEAALRAEQEALAAACPAPAAEAMETGDGEPIFEEVAPPDPDGGGDGGDGGDGDDKPPDEEDDDDIYNMNILIPERLVGRRVARLKKGSSFGENGLHTDGTAQRAATVVAATDRLLLLKLSRDDIQTEQDDDDHISESDEEESPDMDENFEPKASSALRRMSRGSFGDNPLEAKIASLTEGMDKAEEKKEPPPGERRASTTLLGALSDSCPREASIHITVERARRSTVRKPGAAGAAPKAKQSMSKKKTVIKNAQKTDKEINSK